MFLKLFYDFSFHFQPTWVSHRKCPHLPLEYWEMKGKWNVLSWWNSILLSWEPVYSISNATSKEKKEE